MANLKETRNRIRSIKSTQKITKAMKMVATAKLKKIRDSLVSLREYESEIEYLISTTLSRISTEEVKIIESHPLVAEGKTPSHLIIFNTSNKGLCGGINNYNIKHLKVRILELEAKKYNIIIYTIGKKGFDYCLSHFNKYLFNKNSIILDEKNGKQIEAIKDDITNIIVNSKVSSSSIIFTKFVGTTIQNTVELPLTPIKNLRNYNSRIDYEFDVKPVDLALLLIPEFMLCKILLATFENITSEQSARMVAMENASNNAGKAVKNLTLVYNRIRQANITKEISEIVAGAESCK